MNISNDIIRKIINRDYSFCCLCHNPIESEPINFQDEVFKVEVENNYVNNFKMSDILHYVLGNEVFGDLMAFDCICERCSVSAINCYTFIRECKSNIQYLSNVVEHLTNCFENTPGDLQDCKSLFVSLDPALCTSNQYFDNVGHVTTKAKALKRFAAITCIEKPKDEVNVKKEVDTKSNIGPKKRKSLKLGMSTKDMLYDKNNPSDLTCKECFNKFTTLLSLRNHFIRKHMPKKFKCNQCPKSFGSMCSLQGHKEDAHVTLVCSECGKTFHNRQTLAIHEKGHYLKLVCPNCGRIYKNHNTFKKHLDNNICQSETRRSDAKFTCDYCQKRYTQKMTLRVHIQYEHLNYKYLECKWCKKKFWCQSRLKAHIVKHTKERNFVCTTCDRKFVSKESLLYHTRIHTGERPYKCPHCESRFLCASRRTAHIKSHHMDPTVECDKCHSKFRSYHYLQKHKKMTCKADDNSQLLKHNGISELSQGNKVVVSDQSEYQVVYLDQNQKPEFNQKLKQQLHSNAVNLQLNNMPKLEVNPKDSKIKLYYENDTIIKVQSLNSNMENIKLHPRTSSHVKQFNISKRPKVEVNPGEREIQVYYETESGTLSQSVTSEEKLHPEETEELMYQVSVADCQQSGDPGEIYLEVSEDENYVIKVSENVEV